MMAILRKMLHRLCPAWLHRSLYNLFVRTVCVYAIRRYYRRVGMTDEIDAVLRFMARHGSCNMFPYAWAMEKSEDSVTVEKDVSLDLPYVVMEGKRLYFPRSWTPERIRHMFFFLYHVEQHPSSPHCYESAEFAVGGDDHVVDCGAAEGNFSLSVVDRVRRLTIFEAESEWMEPLNATFLPWKDKVEIVQKYVSDEDTEATVRLDSFFAHGDAPTFMKIDVEGAEKKVLLGAQGLLKTTLRKAAVCAYHHASDETELTEFMKHSGFEVAASPGYMFFDLFADGHPFLRRGVLRCTRKV